MKRLGGASLTKFFSLAFTLAALPVLTGANGRGCQAGGDVPVGSDDDPKVCAEAACKDLDRTLDAKICPGGQSLGRTVCAKGTNGACFWDFPACPSDGGANP